LSDTRLRSLVKAVSWRITGVVFGAVLAWILYPLGRETTVLTFTVVYHVVRTIQYYLHERMWEHIPLWRKTTKLQSPD